jgi:transcriptional antiterminator RfaH
MSYWTVVRTTSFRENAVADQLRRAGFPVYLPRTQERARDRQLRTVPLFPCYLFAQVVKHWAPIVATVGVVRLLRAGDGPARLPDYVIDELHKREVDGIVRLPPLRRGQAVRIVRGSLKGQFAIYQGMSGRDREHVLLSFLGREVHAEIRAGDAVAHH